MDLLDLFVKVVFDSEEFEKGVKSVSEKAHKVSEDISQTTSNTVTSIKKETTEIEESAEQTAKALNSNIRIQLRAQNKHLKAPAMQ